jgi:hypothetical protein
VLAAAGCSSGTLAGIVVGAPCGSPIRRMPKVAKRKGKAKRKGNYPRTLKNSQVRYYSWPSILVFVDRWEKPEEIQRCAACNDASKGGRHFQIYRHTGNRPVNDDYIFSTTGFHYKKIVFLTPHAQLLPILCNKHSLRYAYAQLFYAFACQALAICRCNEYLPIRWDIHLVATGELNLRLFVMK